MALSHEFVLEEPLWFGSVCEVFEIYQIVGNEESLMLTGCVAPNIKNDVLAIADIDTRKKQSLEAIKWYAVYTPFKIVFCENSGYDLRDELANLGGKLSSFLLKQVAMAQNVEKVTRIWKSWSISMSTLYFCKEADLLVKITGRLILLNIVSLVKHLDRQKQDFVSAYLYGRRYFSDSRFIFFSPSSFPLLLAQKENIKDWRLLYVCRGNTGTETRDSFCVSFSSGTRTWNRGRFGGNL